METQQVLGDRYELRRRIGVGGMASVFLAHDARLDRDVAVKVLDMAGVSDRTFVERFRREARAAAAINHPNVVAVYDWGESATGNAPVYFLVMEYVPGPNLKARLQREGPFPEDEALRIAAQVASALEAAHSRGLVHRDIKSHNVLIDPSGTAKVADFGIAHLEGLTHLTQTNAVSGSAHYISPEQAQGKRVDARTDVYSLGVVLFELLTGRVPFDGDSLIDVALHHVQDQPVPVRRLRPDISPAAEAIVTRALAKKPENRYATAVDMRAALERARVEATARTEHTSVATAAPVRRASEPPVRSAREVGSTSRMSAAGVAQHPRAHDARHRSRWWLLAVPVLVLALVAGGLVMNAMSHGGTSAAPTSTPGRHAAVTRATRAAPTSTSARPAARATVVPHATTLPAVVAQSTATPVIGSPSAGASSPQGAVSDFYRLVTLHRYAAASALWSASMKANYPPSTNIYGRFDATQAMSVRITGVTNGNRTATVGVGLVETKTDGSVQGYVGSWGLVKSSSGWLLDSVSLNPASVSHGPGHSGHGKGNGGQGGNGGNG